MVGVLADLIDPGMPITDTSAGYVFCYAHHVVDSSPVLCFFQRFVLPVVIFTNCCFRINCASRYFPPVLSIHVLL